MALLPDVKYDRHLRVAPLCPAPSCQCFPFVLHRAVSDQSSFARL